MNVPEPWTPIVIKDTTLECWNRAYEFGGNILPSRIKSGKIELLRGPIQLSAKVAGKQIRWAPASFQVEKSAADAASIAIRTSSENLEVECRYQFEFDGFLLCELVVAPKRGSVELDSLDILVPFTKEYAKLFHHQAVKSVAEQRWATDTMNCGAIPASGMSLPFVHHMWIGDEKRGLQWFAESDEVLRPAGKFLTITGAKTMRLNILSNTTLSTTKPFNFVFGFMASPVKPKLPAGDIRWSLAWTGPNGWNHDISGNPTEPEKSRLAEFHDAGYNAFDVSCDQFMMGEPWNEHPDWPKMIESARNHGMAAMTCSGIWLDMRISKEPTWMLGPPMTWEHWERKDYKGSLMCQRGGWRPWFLDRVDGVFNTLGADGVYFDGSGCPQKCNNMTHGCGYKDESGTLHATLPILPTREVMKRTYMIARATGRKTCIVAHTSSTIMLPCLSFADAYLEGEHVGRFPEDKRYTLAGFRAQMMGHQYGINAFYLKYNHEPGDDDRCSTYALVHDLMPLSPTHLKRWWKVYSEFGADKAQWIPYWEDSRPVTTDADLKISTYVKAGKGALAVVANLTHESILADLNIDGAALGLKSVSAQDAISGSSLQLNGGKVTVTVPAGNYLILKMEH